VNVSLLFRDVLALIRGGGDLASGVAYRLSVAGFPVIIAELPAPLVIRRKAAYGAAVFEGSLTVDGLTSRLMNGSGEALDLLEAGELPVIVDPEGRALETLDPAVLVDARMAKTNLGTTINDAPLVIGLGPGFAASVDCHAVVETNRGHNLGRVIWEGQTEPDTKTPGLIAGHRSERVLRAPTDGYVVPAAKIGDLLDEGDLIATIGESEVRAPFHGVLRGLVHQSVAVQAGLKIGDLDPRANPDFCDTISDKALAIGGGVLEATLASQVIRERLGI
jgi:xanthine dehydrogenase accessory factor